MTVKAFLAAVQRHLIDPIRTWAPSTRGAWCRKQRLLLRDGAGGRVVWIRGNALSWAEWGARQGYFEVQYMDGLPYLRAVGAPHV
jgi:hypothetical protein